MKAFLVLSLGFGLMGCGASHAIPTTTAPMTPLNKTTQYNIENDPAGFKVNVMVKRWSYDVDVGLIEDCKGNVRRIANSEAKKRNKIIQPIHDEDIIISTGRNDFSGNSECSAEATVQYR